MKKTSLLLLLNFGLLLSACQKESGTDTTTLHVRLTDAPANYDAVTVEVKGVEVHYDQGDPNSGWLALNVTPGQYNLLDLANGKDTLLGSAALPVGKISQVRLILGSNNSVTVEGTEYPLSTPSAEQSGLKLQVQADLIRDIDYSILLDFDAGRSIVKTGNGTYKLKPVIRTITTAINGAIQGSVTPAEAHPAVYAVLGQDTVSTFADDQGKFLIKGLAAGSYHVLLVPKSPYQSRTLTGVNVSLGKVTNAGTTTLAD